MRTAQCSLYLSLTLVQIQNTSPLHTCTVQYSAVQYSGEGVYSALLGAGSQLSAVDLGRPVLCCRVLHSAAYYRSQLTADVSVCSVKWSRSGGDTSDNR